MNENTATTVGQIQAEGTSREEQKPQEPVTVSMKKLIAGVGTVFAGVIEMLEALEPHIAGKYLYLYVLWSDCFCAAVWWRNTVHY